MAHGRGRRPRRPSAVPAVLPTVVLAFVLAGCGNQTGTASADLDLDGAWHLVEGRDAEGALPLAGHEVTLQVDGEEVSGRSGCNLYGGSVVVDEDRVRVEQLGSTEMACEPAAMALEQRFLSALGAVRHGDRSGRALALTGPEVSLELSLDPPVEDAPLVGTRWVLESLLEGDTASSTLGAVTLRLLESGALVATTHCGVLRARYRVEGDRVTVTGLRGPAPGATCTPDEEAELRLVESVLRDGFTVRVDGRRLVVDAGGSGLELRADG